MKNLTASKIKKTPSPKLRVESKSDPSRTMEFIARHFKLPTEDQLKISDFLKNKAKQTERSSQALEYTFFKNPFSDLFTNLRINIVPVPIFSRQ